jgi:hypothetical protein
MESILTQDIKTQMPHRGRRGMEDADLPDDAPVSDEKAHQPARLEGELYLAWARAICVD